MRLICAAAVIVMLTGPAFAQLNGGKTPPGPPPPPPKSHQEIAAERAAERAYKDSLSNIPDKPAADPWGNARGVDAPKAAVKTPAKPTKTDSTAN
jgi:hypothetical protein